MLLRRIIEHVRAQNWTAVALEFIIVVVGVLIAFQITAWNDMRITESKTRILTVRLNDDLARHRQTMSWTADYYEAVRRYGAIAATVLDGNTETDDNTLLVAAFRATQVPGYVPSRAAYDELVATGAISVIENENLHRIATLFFEPGIYFDAFYYSESFNYRVRFRELVPAGVHDALREQCGDRYDPLADVGQPRLEIDYDCVVNFPEGELRRAVDNLRADDRLIETLRHRLADLSSNIVNLRDGILIYDEYAQE